MLPAMSDRAFAAFVAGGLWLALWSGRVRLWGLLPILLGTASLAQLRPPDVLVSGDGRHVAIAGDTGELLVLRQSKSTYASDNLREVAGIEGALVPLAGWPGARCSRDACSVTLDRHGRVHTLLLSRNRELIDERALAAACERADIVVSERWLPRSCRPKRLKADRGLLERSGGLAIDLGAARVRTVAESRGNHGWERPRPVRRLH